MPLKAAQSYGIFLVFPVVFKDELKNVPGPYLSFKIKDERFINWINCIVEKHIHKKQKKSVNGFSK